MTESGPVLAVFTVKKFVYVGGTYYTYGGFGDYIRALLPHFSRILLACHPKRVTAVPSGWYALDDPKLEYCWLPYYENELQCLLRLPRMFAASALPAARADIVNARVPDYSGVCGGLWARILRKPVFYSIVADWHLQAEDLSTRTKGVVRLGLRQHLRLYCRLERLLCSRGLAFVQGARLQRMYARNSQAVGCVSTALSVRDVITSPRERCLGGTVRLLTVARLVRMKGLDDLLRAVASIRGIDTERSYTLTMVGEGPCRAELEALARELGVMEQVKFVGQLGRQELFSEFDRADVFCLPSHAEGTPKVLLEALGRGVPVVATDVGGVPTVVQHETTGLLVPPRSPESLAKGIVRLAADPALRSRCVERGLATVRSYTSEQSWGAVVSRVRLAYPDLWSSRDC